MREPIQRETGVVPSPGRSDLDELLDAAQSHPSLARLDYDSYAELVVVSGDTMARSVRADRIVEVCFPREFRGIELPGGGSWRG